MTNNLQQLYYLVNDEVSAGCIYREKLSALAQAKIVLYDKLEELCDSKDATAMMEAYFLLEDERQNLHNQALFEATLSLGMELGRLSAPA